MGEAGRLVAGDGAGLLAAWDMDGSFLEVRVGEGTQMDSTQSAGIASQRCDPGQMVQGMKVASGAIGRGDGESAFYMVLRFFEYN
jgi:hypothetical protein